VAPERVDEGPHPTPADERHDNVNRIRRRNLGPKLVPDSRLAARIGEDGRVEQRRKRALDRLQSPIRKTLQQPDQHARRVDRLVAFEIVPSVREGLEATKELDSDPHCLHASLALGRALNRSRDDAGDVP
jgi:hypothetical protein